MYYCFSCDREFRKPENVFDSMEEFWGAPAPRYYGGCPYCKDIDIVEVIGECFKCEERIFEDDGYEEIEGETVCMSCYNKWVDEQSEIEDDEEGEDIEIKEAV